MKQYLNALCLLAAALIFVPAAFSQEKKQDSLTDADLNKRISYALGYDIARKLTMGFDLDPDAYEDGIKDAWNKAPDFSDEQIRQLLMDFQKMVRQKQAETIRQESKKNRDIGSRFLAENITKQGVKNLPSGLQYKVLEKGTGPVPKLTDTVECHYKGQLTDGTVFDSSYKRGNPAVFQVSGVIKGWQQALEKMPVGSRWMLFVPPDLAYGDKGAGDLIRPGATLVFEVKLLSIME